MSKAQVINRILLTLSLAHLINGDYQSTSSFLAASFVVAALPRGEK